MKAAIKVLSIEDSPGDALLIRKLLDETRTGYLGTRFELATADCMAGALNVLNENRFDVIILDLTLPDSEGMDSLLRLLPAAAGAPVIIFTGNSELEYAAQSVRLGADDYLVKGRTNSALLVRAIRYALERKDLLDELRELRHREQTNRELQLFSTLVSPAKPGPGTAKHCTHPLKEREPACFQALVSDYCRALDMTFDERIFSVHHDVPAALRALAKVLGDRGADPRDVIDVHTTALQSCQDAASPNFPVYLEEARFAALALMGYLTVHYRSMALQSDHSYVPDTYDLKE